MQSRSAPITALARDRRSLLPFGWPSTRSARTITLVPGRTVGLAPVLEGPEACVGLDARSMSKLIAEAGVVTTGAAPRGDGLGGRGQELATGDGECSPDRDTGD
jgi:hypothetical protein